jgi:hypothetical protein
MTESIPDASRLVPVRVADHVERLPDGRLRITRRRHGAVGRRLLRMARIDGDLSVTLDLVASAAWELADGRTVGEMLSALRAQFPAEPDLAARLGKFIGTMASNGFLRLD